MAGRGPAPAETRQRGRDNKRTTLTYDGVSVWGDPLPDDLPAPPRKGETEPGVLVWHPMTVAWYDAWRRWPLLEGAHPVSWNYLIATALMVNQMWTAGRWDFAAEVRLREAKFGATPADLRSLGYDYELEGTKDEDGKPTAPGTVTDISARKLRLAGEAPAAEPAKKAIAAKKAPTKRAAAKKTTSPRVKMPAGVPEPPY